MDFYESEICLNVVLRLPYDDHFAGVTVFTPMQYKRINGHSNAFWGWGGEDLDLFKRFVII